MKRYEKREPLVLSQCIIELTVNNEVPSASDRRRNMYHHPVLKGNIVEIHKENSQALGRPWEVRAPFGNNFGRPRSQSTCTKVCRIGRGDQLGAISPIGLRPALSRPVSIT